MSGRTETVAVDQSHVAVDVPRVVVDEPRCWTCGAELAPSRTRPRETCSPACQKLRGFVLRRIARRRQWIREWERYAAAGRVGRLEAANGIAELQRAIEELQAPLWPTVQEER